MGHPPTLTAVSDVAAGLTTDAVDAADDGVGADGVAVDGDAVDGDAVDGVAVDVDEVGRLLREFRQGCEQRVWMLRSRAELAAAALAVRPSTSTDDVLRIVDAGVTLSPEAVIRVCSTHRFDSSALARVAASLSFEAVDHFDVLRMARSAAVEVPAAAVILAAVILFWMPVGDDNDEEIRSQVFRLGVLAGQFDAASAQVAVQLCGDLVRRDVSAQDPVVDNDEVLSLLEAASLLTSRSR